ncbi:polyphosphate:AMP phosphotransferase [Hahella sp. CR1]|uniref:polyphosphate:AMP phosphotransferase n=1 Tax=unclassified Hahella TaxID=2624107 RepID=UPI002441B58C|nr:polyphosphate:AMP phosphotransferase [Hahella sp. CR1]MDG9670104.1 polyphosphate:AMP phosphotransferase [Hahella sp. CR1]
MFEAVELGRKLDKKDYKKQAAYYRDKLLFAQFALVNAGVPVYILLEGVDNTCKGEVVNLLNQWLDTRGLEVTGFGPKTDEEAERPRFWRYWRTFPARGRFGLFYGSWYTGELIKRSLEKQSKVDFDSHMLRINRLESMLAQDGALILKFWLHTSKAYQKRKFKELKKDKHGRWQVSELDEALHERYSDYIKAAERAVRLTDQPETPWIVVESEDDYFRNIMVAKTILQALEKRLAEEQEEVETIKVASGKKPPGDFPTETVLNQIDLSADLSREEYEERLALAQTRLNSLSWRAYHQGVSTVLLFEGWDAAGKGGAIRRIMEAVDARIARVISIAAPTDEEKAHHYLWRFWRHVPRAGRATIYDRSWYGRVLVERVEGFASVDEWRRAYSEINDFEEQLCDHGNVLLKFWLHIDQEEQLRRFEERKATPRKRYKITDEDWRNREKWPAYEQAAHEMIMRTSTDYAPWTLVPANSKRHARVTVLETLCDRLEKALQEKRG